MKSSILVAATAALLAVAAPAGAADVKVWRGGVAGAGLVERTQTGHRVTEVRGLAASAAVAVARAEPTAGQPIVAAGGTRFWVYDPAAARLTVCRDTPTSKVGASVIDCQRTRFDR
jgi:hypothetical protein